ncbi:uncharacterized protein TA13815 [Theileria annulata]|uniref:Hypothetical Theileria specific protein n=1 Tax=Theileria annulata TaxID=5874 RepID=Q4UEQ7_THEAN|nr:uncharacterized protein TA13815 [Theileria annulata]CAI74432.1 hypothetical Theileria specific protein [Theileria annulata]|eukprot:XP_952164.1 hypothetical Theileria specific protein [Theileria annulata]
MSILFTFICASVLVGAYYVSVDIDWRATDSSSTHMITNNKTKELCPDGYTKFVAERPDCFSVSGVRLGNQSIQVDGSDIVLHYIYGIESYWKYNTPIMIRFKKYHGWEDRVYPAYVLTKSGKWKEERTYYWEKNITTGHLRIILDDVLSDVKDIVEQEKGKGTNSVEEDDEKRTREFEFFEGDKLRGKKSDFKSISVPLGFLVLHIFYILALG